MLAQLFAALGVDYAQWMALTKVALKLDWRQTSLGNARMTRKSVHAGLAIVSQLIFYTVVGAVIALVAWRSTDVFLVGLILTGYVFFIAGTAVLLDHNSALTSPTDYAVLGFQPVSSRTYFAARLTNVLVYTTAITTAAAWLPMGALFLSTEPRWGWRAWPPSTAARSPRRSSSSWAMRGCCSAWAPAGSRTHSRTCSS